ncbi:phage distal tail protein, Rcc01695 family [Aureimonas ureilytica]|uniref:phage distal tail protein, Rcc01695 family n=1 Tax=Aureimonas ureilytica TaxID=401562 RepID=UPI003CE8E798
MVASFSEERFPLSVAFGTSGGPERRTDIVRLSTGYENRNQRTRHSWRRYDAGSGVKSLADLIRVLDFFEARRGRLVGFRFRDPFDAASARWGQAATALDQLLGTGDGETRSFQLAKRYGTGEDAYVRPIRKPVAGTVRLAVDGVAAKASVEATSGLVTFASPPPPGSRITAGFEFDVPVRFDIDHLALNVAAFEAGDIPTIPLVEIRP